MNITNNNGLLCEEKTNRCLGYLINFDGRGVFSPDGKVEVTPEHAKRHNEILSQGEIKGLDDYCQVGQGGTFYFIGGEVKTFIGDVVSSDCKVKGKMLYFARKGKRYRGIIQKDVDCFNFKRVA